MPPKYGKNAFFNFMISYKKDQEACGREFPGGLRDVASEASPLWEGMSEKEKARFTDQLEQKRFRHNSHNERYTSVGISQSQIKAQQNKERAKVQWKKQKVQKILSEAIAKNALETTPFCIIGFNYFALDKSTEKYYPAELGVVKFNIKKGVTKKLHSFINPGSLPVGFMYPASAYSAETHKIPLPPNTFGETNYEKILTSLTKFIISSKSVPDADELYFYTLESEMQMTENILHQFCTASQIDPKAYKVLPLGSLFEHLRLAVERLYEFDVEVKFTEETALNYLTHNHYSHYKEMGCEFHEGGHDVNNYCALAVVTRWAYAILEQVIDIVGIEKKLAGFHFPPECEDTPVAMALMADDEGRMKAEDEEEDVKSERGSVATASSFHGELADQFSDLISESYRDNMSTHTVHSYRSERLNLYAFRELHAVDEGNELF